MPKERIFGPQDYETYGQHMERLKEARLEDYTASSKAASLLATVMMMQPAGKNKRIDREKHSAMRRQIESSKAFKRLMKDPKTLELIGKNDTDGLFAAMAELETKRQQELDRKYKRPEDKQLVAADAKLLKSAIDGLKKKAEGAPTTGSPEIEQRGKRYQEMMKQLETAQTLAESGVQMSGESTKALIDAVKAYNDGGTKYVKPGGEKEAEGFVESMALLKNYMPAADFKRYCRRMNTGRGVENPANPDYVAPEAFEPQRLTGSKTAKELTQENMDKIRDSFTLDVAAESIAIRQLSGGDPNRLISPEALNKEKSKLKQPGTAFMRVMQDDKAREDLRHLADMGEVAEVVQDLDKGIDREKERRYEEARKRLEDVRNQARKKVVRSAQGEINRSIRRLTGDTPLNRHFTEQHLANILASEQLAMSAKGNEQITNGAFRERAEQLRQDPAFRRLAERYMDDAAFRENMNRGLLADRSAQTLAAQYEQERQPLRARREPERAPEANRREEPPVIQRDVPDQPIL